MKRTYTYIAIYDNNAQSYMVRHLRDDLEKYKQLVTKLQKKGYNIDYEYCIDSFGTDAACAQRCKVDENYIYNLLHKAEFD